MNAEAYTALIRALRTMQDGRCGICGVADDLVIDHDHDNGMVRGLLCHTCNVEEGRHNCDGSIHWCDVCRWRAVPAVTWIGWTVRHSASAVAGPRFAPSSEAIAEWQAADQACADVMAGKLG